MCEKWTGCPALWQPDKWLRSRPEAPWQRPRARASVKDGREGILLPGGLTSEAGSTESKREQGRGKELWGQVPDLGPQCPSQPLGRLLWELRAHSLLLLPGASMVCRTVGMINLCLHPQSWANTYVAVLRTNRVNTNEELLKAAWCCQVLWLAVTPSNLHHLMRTPGIALFLVHYPV